jgi:DNA-binding transcriptional regulator YiaG
MAIDELLADVRIRSTLPPPAERRAIRECAGLTQVEVARLLGVTKGTVARWEAGRRHPRRKVRLRYALLLARLAHEEAGEVAA